MTPLERLRLATALVHAVPGAELRIRTTNSEQICVSHAPAGDIDPCKLRQIVAASACPNRPDLSQRIAEMTVGGSLIDVGGGIAATRCGGREQRWITSLLPYQKLTELLDDVGHGDVPANAIQASLKPDPELGVTVVGITANDARFDHALDNVAAQVAAACFVAELCSDVAISARSNNRIEGAS